MCSWPEKLSLVSLTPFIEWTITNAGQPKKIHAVDLKAVLPIQQLLSRKGSCIQKNDQYTQIWSSVYLAKDDELQSLKMSTRVVYRARGLVQIWSWSLQYEALWDECPVRSCYSNIKSATGCYHLRKSHFLDVLVAIAFLQQGSNCCRNGSKHNCNNAAIAGLSVVDYCDYVHRQHGVFLNGFLKRAFCLPWARGRNSILTRMQR